MAATRYPYPLISFIVLAGGCNPAPDPLPNPLDGCGWSEAETEGALGLAESPEFQSYMEDHVIELDEGGWVAEGDIIIDDFNTLLSHYQRAAMPTEQNGSDSGFRSTASCGGFLSDHLIDAIWNPAAKLAITYCFDASWDDVPDYRDIAEEGLANATLRWETAADVNFIQLPSGSSCSHENGVVYEIQYVPSDFGSGFYALTSFPDEDEHTLQLFTRAFGEDAFFPLDYLFTHELGHSLGLYHEHARFAQGNLQCLWTAGAPSFWRGLTAADPDSVMGYPQCVGPSPMPPHPSALDRTGLGFLYNLSRPILSGPMGLDSGVLVWHRPSTSDYVVWQPVGGGNQPLAFSETEGCYEPGCETLESSEYWKPLLYRNDSSVDVFMYGPAHYEERRLMGMEDVPESDAPGTISTNVDVPLVLDRFFGGTDRSVWWIRPGAPNDSLWRNLDGPAQPGAGGDAPPFTDEHYSPVAGRLINNRSSVFWLSPTRAAAYLTYGNGNAVHQTGVNKLACGLDAGVRYNAVPGDFDGDGLDEIIWYDFDTGNAWYWPQLPQCLGGSEVSVGQAKLSAFRFDGATDVLMAYEPQHGLVRFVTVPYGDLLAMLPQPVDASPVLRDFDADGCTDILWFAPHQPTSSLWHSNCDTTFRETFVQHPTGAYPLGYGLGQGRR
jgi:hypothetical protein